MNFIRRIFITGFVVLFPLVITIYIIVGLFTFADAFLGRYINNILRRYLGFYFPGLGIVLALVIIFLLGLLGIIFRGRFIKFLESIITRIPLMGHIYPAIRRITDFLVSQRKPTFKRVVLVEYPHKGIYSLGFVTNESSEKLKSKLKGNLFNVFVPFTPSPLTGIFLVVAEEELIFLDMGIDEGLRLIVSGGVLNPEDLTKE